MTGRYFIRRRTCPACKSEEFDMIFSCKFTESPIKEYLESFYGPQGGIEFGYLNNSRFILNSCGKCGLVYQENIPNDYLMRRIYEEWIDPTKSLELHKKSMQIKDYLYYTRELVPIIAHFNRVPGQLMFLDHGMGWGSWCLIAKAFGCDSYGTELSEARIRYAKSNGIKVIAWDDLVQYRFHFINMEQVFEHLPEPYEALIHLKKCLRPEGLLKISVPNGTDIKRRLRLGDWKAPKDSRNSLNPIAPLEHINCFAYESIIHMAELTGFQRVKLPLRIQYAYSLHRWTLKEIIKSILRPLYRNFFNNPYVFLCKRNPDR